MSALVIKCSRCHCEEIIYLPVGADKLQSILVWWNEKHRALHDDPDTVSIMLRVA